MMQLRLVKTGEEQDRINAIAALGESERDDNDILHGAKVCCDLVSPW